jgi:hypothetical protein
VAVTYQNAFNSGRIGDVTMKRNGNHRVEFLSPEEGKKLLDRQARRYLKMSGEEFVRKWKAKKIKNPDRPEVMQVAFLIPFGG